MDFTIRIFSSYVHDDISYLSGLKAQLAVLQRQGLISIWDASDILAGVEWESEIDVHLNSADIILLLISPDFMNSDRCFNQMMRAMERSDLGEARVIPIILRPVSWKDTPIDKLAVLPAGAIPISDPTWPSRDYALNNVAEGIQKVCDQLRKEQLAIFECMSNVVMKQANKAYTEASKKGMFSAIVCPECGNSALTCEPSLDFARGERYQLIHCSECGWQGKMTDKERKSPWKLRFQNI